METRISMRINSLQSIKYFLALLIFHHHYFLHPQKVQFGAFPVATFFILSGFFMTMGYADKVESPGFEYKKYIKKRLLRILPLNIICLGLFIIHPLLIDISKGSFIITDYIKLIPNLFLLQSWIPLKEIYFSGYDIAWFLSDILFCYVVFPFLVSLLRIKKSNLIILLILFLYLSAIQIIPDNFVHGLVYINPVFRLIDFVIGIKLCMEIIPKIKESERPFVGSLIEIFAIVTVVVFLSMYDGIPLRYSWTAYWWIPSVILIASFAISSRWGGYFQGYYRNHSSQILGQ